MVTTAPSPATAPAPAAAPSPGSARPHAALLRARLAESAEVKARLAADEERLAVLDGIAQALVASLRAGGQVFFFGNGGSSTDAAHLAAELVGRYGYDRPPLPSWSLADATAAVTAIGNDYGYDEVFARQLRAAGRPGDVAVGLTTSGTSPNVVAGLRAARAVGLVTVGFTGERGRALAAEVDHLFVAPSDETPRVQECHLLAGHSLCEVVETELFPRGA